MRPNTPHVVFTAEHSVCFGGHFYASPVLRDTYYSIIHTFVMGTLVTNADHTEEAFLLLARLAAFYENEFMNVMDMVDTGMCNIFLSNSVLY
jgi:hypothetical protein